jgi:pimeloyl-ACP methyl ester carboxylesterase
VSSPAAQIVLTSALLTLAALVAFLAYAAVRYTPIIGRIFEDKPMFLPLRVPRIEEGDDVRFKTGDGLDLAGTYLKARTSRRTGVLVFCHEYLSDRWSVLPYADHLRDQGFDLFTFDYRNHGESGVDPAYKPLQWVTDHELTDLDAALAYLRTRPDADLAGVGLFGVSRGGGTALCVASRDPRVWGVITDGAFPTRGTMLAYILRWAEIYVGSKYLWKAAPVVVFDYLGWVSRLRAQARLRLRYANVERGVARLSPRPWLAIHGQKDAYIGVDIARELFNRAGGPKELWIVEGAKHNRCREKEPVAYADRIVSFLLRYAPRSLREAATESQDAVLPEDTLHAIPEQADLGVAVSSS